jgi:hydroxyacylglutathione hydrolase
MPERAPRCAFGTTRSIATAFFAAMVSFAAHAESTLAGGSLDVKWNEGAEDCSAHPPPPLQVHRYNERTLILRENLCLTYEAPFVYLLIGSNRAVLIDTGDVEDAAQVPLADTVLSLLPGTGASRLPLLVVHTHGHLDHRAGDGQFAGMPNVEVIAIDLPHVQSYFEFVQWPDALSKIDLGGRIVDVIPTPGHTASSLSYYDRETGLFFSGDFLLPGRLRIEDADADLASAQRVVAFAKTHPLSHVLGGHIEFDEHGELFPLGSTWHPHERRLEMSADDLAGLPEVVRSFNGFYNRSGVYVLVSQNRIAMALGVGVIVVLVGVFIVVRRFWRRRRRRRLERSGA